MKNKKFLALSVFSATAIGLLTGCGADNTVTIWVGSESVDFYNEVANEFINNQADGSEFKNFKVKVVGTDTGSAAGSIMTDNTAAGDIYTVAHDNIGKLVEAAKARPLIEESLVKQVADDNPAAYTDVIHHKFGDETYLFGAPYISQALFLYYNKDVVSDEQAQSFEGLQAAAKAVSSSTKATVVTDTSGFNFSFTVLARKAADNSTTLKLYEGGDRKNVYFQGEDSIATTKWAQRFYADPNGLAFPSEWAQELQNKKAVSLIGGAWHYNAFKASVANVGISLIPTFTFTDADVEGTEEEAGTVMRGGTFADCKVFMINSNCADSKYQFAQALIKYMTSKTVQDRSFKTCLNVPAYSGADTAIKTMLDAKEISQEQYDLASNQIKMAEYGIAQPFVDGRLNTFYYSKNAPDVLKNAVVNDKDAYGTTQKIREAHYTMQYIWENGATPESIPSTLPASTHVTA